MQRLSHLVRYLAGMCSTWEDMRVVRPRPRRRIGDPILVDRWVTPDMSARMGRTAGVGVPDAQVRPNHFKPGRTRWVASLEMPADPFLCPNVFDSVRLGMSMDTKIGVIFLGHGSTQWADTKTYFGLTNLSFFTIKYILHIKK
jgi:hypothetical protein